MTFMPVRSGAVCAHRYAVSVVPLPVDVDCKVLLSHCCLIFKAVCISMLYCPHLNMATVVALSQMPSINMRCRAALLL